MAIKVYGVTLSNNVVRVIAALNEKGLEYKFVPVDLAAGETSIIWDQNQIAVRSH